MSDQDKEQPSSTKMTILEELCLLRKEIESLKKRIYVLETWSDLTAGYIEELLKTVGIR